MERVFHFFASIFFLCLAGFETIPIINRAIRDYNNSTSNYNSTTATTQWRTQWSVSHPENADRDKLYVLAFGVAYINLFTTAVLCLKYKGLKNINVPKCQLWVYLEILNIFLLTTFILIACIFLFPPPFDNMTGVPLLFLVYWFPLVVFKIYQISRMRQLIRNFDDLSLFNDYEANRKTGMEVCFTFPMPADMPDMLDLSSTVI